MPRPPRSKGRDDAVTVAARRARIAELHRRRYTVVEIAAEIKDVTARQIANDLDAIRAAYEDQAVGSYGEAVADAAMECDALSRDIYKTLDQVTEPELRATFIALAIKVLERRCSLLGLDARKETGGSPIFRKRQKTAQASS